MCIMQGKAFLVKYSEAGEILPILLSLILLCVRSLLSSMLQEFSRTIPDATSHSFGGSESSIRSF